MVAKCYLCKNKCNKNENICLHRFPKKNPIFIHTHQQWLNVCGLNEQDDVSNVYICTRHFQSSVYRIKDKRLRLHCGAIPTIDVLNPVVVKEEIIIEDDDETATNISPETLAYNITIDDRIEEQLTSPNSNIDTENNKDHEEQLIFQRSDTGESDTLQFDISESVTPVKKRRFAQARYISEIDLCDVATSRRAKRTLSLVKLTDKKKSKQIKRLQDTNRRLNKQIFSLQQMVSDIRKKELIRKMRKM